MLAAICLFLADPALGCAAAVRRAGSGLAHPLRVGDGVLSHGGGVLCGGMACLCGNAAFAVVRVGAVPRAYVDHAAA